MRNLALLILCVTIMFESLSAEEPIVFISAFTSGDAGAIHAYRFDAEKGQLKLLQRTTGIENPFFLAISPNQKFLYAINAKQFGSKDDEFVAAYKIQGREGKLTKLNQQTSRGSASCYLDVDATGKTICWPTTCLVAWLRYRCWQMVHWRYRHFCATHWI